MVTLEPELSPLPPLLGRGRLADDCREVAARERVAPSTVEKDYYLSRLLTALAHELADAVLLKGGTLLSKVDLVFKRMSEDVDLVVPGVPSSRKRENAKQMQELQKALLRVSASAGVTVPFPHGERTERDAHAEWEIRYDSDFGPQRIIVEASIRPVLRRPRRVELTQLLTTDPAYDRFCWALDEVEARAEKVRAAFTRRAIRDYYDLEQLILAGKDLSSSQLISLVNDKLAELGAAALAQQPRAFGMTSAERATLKRAAKEELRTVLRVDEPELDLDALLARFDTLWKKS